MDLFEDILKQASSNTKSAKKEIKKIDEACQKTKKCAQKEVKISEPSTQKPKFVIPKKKADEKQAVDKSKIALFLKKKEEEKQKALTEKNKQKEELIKLRMQLYGGKATKKLAKQFGSTPIELQQKYGNDHGHEQHLKKLEVREKEEANRLNNAWRGNIMKVLERKKTSENLAGSESRKNGPHKVVTEKKNNLTKEDPPKPSISVISDSRTSKSNGKSIGKRRLPPVESNFNLLMKKAKAIQNGKLCRTRSPSSMPLPAKRKNVHHEVPERGNKEAKTIDHKKKPKTTDNNNNRPMTGQQSSSVANKAKNIKNGNVDQQEKASLKASAASLKPGVAAPERRYLPGDIRYQGPPVKHLQPNNRKENNSSSANGNAVKNIKNDAREKIPGKVSAEGRKTANNGRQDRSRPKMSREEAIARIKAGERLLMERRRRLEELRRQERDVISEDVEDEDYDSEMDDFIDDSELDEHLKRGDLEETLRLINPRYDRNRWKLRERMIDDRHMEASYREIAREEKRSSRIGLIEDIREAQRGKSIAL